MRIVSGDTTKYIYFVAVDITDLKTRETGLTTFTVYRSRNGGASAVMTTPTINETDTTNMPGVYELLLDEDMTIDAGDQSQAMVFHITQASMAPVTLEIELYRPDVTAGETLTVGGGIASADVVEISSDATAANNAEAFFDGTGYAGTGNVIPTVTTLTNLPAITANWLTAAGMAADASAEIADAVWDEDATAHQTGGTFGQAIGDPGADTNTIFKAVVTDATGATVGVDVVAVKSDTAAILVDTTEIGVAGAGLTNINLPNQTMDITGSLSGSVGSVTGAVGSVTGLTAATVHSDLDDIQARLPAALVGGKIDAVADVTAISGDTTAADNLESEYDGTGYGHILQRTTIATLASQTSFTLTAGSADDNAYNGCIIVIQDATTAAQKAVAVVGDYTGATKTVTLLNDPAVFVMAATDIVTIIADRSLKATVDNRTLDVSATGEGGLDWANIGSPTTAQNLSATNIDVDQVVASVSGAVGSVAAGGITATSIATGAIDADALAADAVTEIQAGLATPTNITAGVITTVTNLTNAPTSGDLTATMKASVNAEVVDVVATDTLTLPGQAAPPLAPTMREVLGWIYKTFRNRKTQTATQWSLMADDEVTVDSKAVVSSDGTTSIKQEVSSGP